MHMVHMYENCTYNPKGLNCYNIVMPVISVMQFSIASIGAYAVISFKIING